MSKSLLIALPVAGLLLLQCSNTPTSNREAFVHDTLYQTFLHEDSRLTHCYLYLFKRNGLPDSVLSTCRNPLDTFTLTKWVRKDYIELRLPTYTVTTRISHHPGAVDTITVNDTINRFIQHFDTARIEMPTPPESIDAYIRSHPPRVTNKDLLIARLGTVPEGVLRKTEIRAFHFRDDNAEIVFVNKPIWATIQSAFECVDTDKRVYSRCDTVKASSAPTNGCGETSSFGFSIFCDSTMVDSTYHWQMILRNKYGAADTVSFTSYAQRDSCLLNK
jgi:hypothetical protein